VLESRSQSARAFADRSVGCELDLALVWGDGSNAPHAERVAELPVCWIGRADWPGVPSLAGEPIPFVAFAPPCAFRSAAVTAMDNGGLPWRLVFTSPSLSGLFAAAAGGLGITARTTIYMPKVLSVLDPKSTGLPTLPSVPLALHHAEADPSPAVARLKDILLQTIRTQLE
jgi:DNA-binding transcriptional LysR family regulator